MLSETIRPRSQHSYQKVTRMSPLLVSSHSPLQRAPLTRSNSAIRSYFPEEEDPAACPGPDELGGLSFVQQPDGTHTRGAR